ncbi:MAG: fibronectin type III domain-containing protein [Muribaculaceae bacterium]|nr:fibronectin type III domain-containing protein [Muribaculaceae bacterium]
MKKLLLSLLTLFGAANLAVAQTEPVLLLDADFSVFTDGSDESPIDLYSSTFKSKIEGFNYATSVASAGGKLLIKANGYIETNYFNAIPSTGNSTVRVTAEVKMTDSYGGCVNFRPGYSTTGEVSAIVEGDEWTTVSTYVSSFTSTTRLRVQPFLSVGGFYIKSLKVEYSPDFIAAPEAYLPTDADGTSFTASCSRVSGASSYEADVFTLNGDEPEYAEQNVELKPLGVYSDPSAKITGLDPEKTYYYVVRAVNAAGAKSDDSEIVKVVRKISEMTAPEALAATNITETGFTANWDTVDNAVAYVVNTYEETTLAADTDIKVFEEDFSGVDIGSFSSVEFSGDINSFTKLPGWITDMSKAYAKGYFVFSIFSGNTGELILPAIDLSANDGKFTLTVNAATARYGTFYTTNNTITVELLDGDNVIETAPVVKCDKDDFFDFTFAFTKGKEASTLKITYTLAEIVTDDKVENDPNKLFIDDIYITQLLAAGSVVEKQLSSEETEGTSLDIKLTPEEGKTYSYAVAALGETVVGSGSSAAVGTIQSAFSEKVTVNFKTSGIDEITAASEAAAWKAGDGILGINGSSVTVHDLMGRTLLNKQLPAGSHSLRVNMRGLVIVTVDGKSFKIIL